MAKSIKKEPLGYPKSMFLQNGHPVLEISGFDEISGLEVISGMSEILKNKQLKAGCIEVHFRRLDERGVGHAPREIENRLKRAGFSVNWCDPSHIIATRGLSR